MNKCRVGKAVYINIDKDNIMNLSLLHPFIDDAGEVSVRYLSYKGRSEPGFLGQSSPFVTDIKTFGVRI